MQFMSLATNRPPRRMARTRATAIVLAFGLTFALCGCKQSVDLSAVNDLAKTAATSQSAFDDLATDFGESCLRRTVYETIGSAMEQYTPRKVSPPKAVARRTVVAAQGSLSVSDLATLSPQELVRRLTPAVAGALTEAQFIVLATRSDSAQILGSLSPATLTALDQSPSAKAGTVEGGACADELAVSRTWQQSNAIVVNYFIALGKLAGGVPADDSYGLKALGNDVASSKVLSAPRATAIAGFANDVLTQIYDAKRRGALAQYIPEADKSLGNAIAALESLATDDYVHSLTRERVVANRFFQRNLQLSKPGEQAFQVLSYADTWSDRMKSLDGHVAATRSYVNSWETLRSGHTKLLKAIQTNDARSALAIAQSIYSAIAPDITAIKKAYPEGK